MKRRRYRKQPSKPKADAATVRVPHDPVNEQVVIAAVIVDAGARRKYLRTLQSELFHGNGHADVWTVLQTMERKGLHYDPATLKQLGGASVDVQYIEGLIEQRPVVPPNLAHHVEMLRWDAARVSVAAGPLTNLLELIRDPQADPLALKGVVKRIESGLNTGTNHSLRNPQQLLQEQREQIHERRKGTATYELGIPELDYYTKGEMGELSGKTVDMGGHPRLIPGTAPKNVTVVTGVSGSGKTTATARCVLGMANAGRRIAYGAYEQGSGMSLELLATMQLGFSRTVMKTGEFTDEQEAQLFQEMERISSVVKYDEIPYDNFVTRKKYPNERAMDRIAQSIIDSNCEVYVADLFRRALSETDPDEEERALYRMQQMAHDLHVHIILVQQQNLKQVEVTRSKLPRRNTIKGTGAWVEVPDQIIGWHLPALWKDVPDDTIYGLVLKQRDGKWPMMVEFDWNREYGSITNGRGVKVQFGDREEDEADDDFWNLGKGK